MIYVAKFRMDSAMKHMSERLRVAREEAGFPSATKAAEALGVSASTYRAHENGQNEYGVSEANAYARKFNVSPIWLMFGAGDKMKDQESPQPEYDGSPVAEIDVRAGMGGGGVPEIVNAQRGKFTVSADAIRARWILPDWFIVSLGVEPKNLFILPAQGDSMEPTISDGDLILINSAHRTPSPDGIYAILDDFGGVVLKRLEVFRKNGGHALRIISDNKSHTVQERGIDEVAVLGSYLRRITR